MKEIWKPIAGWEDSHEVSNLGNVRSLDRTVLCRNGVEKPVKGKVLSPFSYLCKKQGYTRDYITLGAHSERGVYLVHRLVAYAFCVKPEGCNVVNHIDCNPGNNRAENLEWTTHKGNSRHAAANGRYSTVLGSRKGAAKLTESQVEEIIRRLHNKEEQKKIANDFGVAAPIISNINRGFAWVHVTVPECGTPPYFLKRAA